MRKLAGKNNKVELLAPAGSLEKMKYACSFGADAVYLGLPDFSLRVRINKFSEKDFKEAVSFARLHGKKVYVTLNIYAHNHHLEKVKKHLEFLNPFKVDAVIASDPGIISLVKKYLPEVDIHLSTQANATNVEAVKFWRDAGVKRVILARELSLEEIREISKRAKGVELEAFVHGAMCMSYSGRCILSKWMTGRSANLGDCSQPCRWRYKNQKPEITNNGDNYSGIALEDDQRRFGMEVEEDRHGTYFFNSYDLNLIEHVEDLIGAGVVSLKIEGRAKSAYYVAVVTRAYRKVLDAISNGKAQQEIKNVVREQKEELDNLTHRGYSTGFILGEEPPHNFSGKIHGDGYKFVGEVVGEKDGLNVVRVHNEIYLDEKVDILTPEKNIPVKIVRILDDMMKETSESHGGHDKIYYFEFDNLAPVGSLIRKRIS